MTVLVQIKAHVKHSVLMKLEILILVVNVNLDIMI